MNLRKSALSFLLIIHTLLYASTETLNINFSDLSIEKLIHITSKQINKNILIVDAIEGNVDFVSNKSISSSELLQLLKAVLESRGYKLVEEKNFLKVTKQEILKDNTNKVMIVTLQNADAKSLLPILEDLLKNSMQKSQLRISHDNSTNAIILYGQKPMIDVAQSIIKRLDYEKFQVYVEAKIIEQSEIETKNLGVRYGISGLNVSGNSIFSLGANLGGVANAVDDSIFSLFSFEPTALQSAISLGATLNFLNENQVIDIVSQPSILCMNNKESIIYVGETKSFQTGTTTTDGGTTNNSFQREDIGLTLKIKPRVSSQSKVVLEIETIQEDAKELKVGQTNPDTTKKEVKTTAIVANGESVILGGLIKNKMTTIEDSVPFFSDIPLLGNLFKDTKNAKDKINLVVILTPYIVPNSQKLTDITQELNALKDFQKRFAQKIKQRLLENKSMDNETKAKSNHQSKLYLKELGLPYE